MLSRFYGTDSERQRLVQVSQALHDSLQGCILATRTLLHLLSQHLDTSVSLEPVGGDIPVGQSLEHLLWAAREIHAAAEQTDRHVQKNASRELYARLASPYSSLQEKAAIVQDFHQATMGIFGSVGGPVVAVVLQNAGLPERLEAALREAEASPVLLLPVDALLLGSEEIARALSTPTACAGPAGDMPAGPPESSPVSGTGLVQTLQGYLPEALTGCRARNAVMAATGHLEEARQALAPACKSFQLLAVEAEVYMGLIAEQQLGRAEGQARTLPVLPTELGRQSHGNRPARPGTHGKVLPRVLCWLRSLAQPSAWGWQPETVANKGNPGPESHCSVPRVLAQRPYNQTPLPTPGVNQE